MNRWSPLIIVVISIIAAVALRAPKLPLKPMHGDEGINAYKFDELWTSGEYQYDPHEYHGPSLPYFTTIAMFLDGRGYAGSSEATFRAVNVAFGVLLVAIVWVIRHGIGSWETAVAAALTAASPAMVFYSRYHIHEMLLVFFTFAAVAAGWRYVRTRHAGAALACGASLAMMHATKETFVIAVAAMVWAILLVFVWGNIVVGKSWRITPPLRWKVIAAAIAVGAAVSAVLFSGFGTNWEGPIDSILAYTTYLERGAGNSEHNKPWHYYLRLLGWNRYGRGPIWTELFILMLAAIGAIEALRPRAIVRRVEGRGFPIVATSGKEANEHASEVVEQAAPDSSLWFWRFTAFYTISVIFIYSIIRYKTPWCVLSFLHGAILLAGVGGVALVRWMPHVLLKVPIALLLVAGTVHLGWQSYRLSFDPRLVAAPSPLNPYTYSQPRPGVLTAAKRIEQIAKVSPRKQDLRVLLAVPGNDYWPLPWYLRTFPGLDFSDGLEAAPSESDAPEVIITAAVSADEPPAWLGERYAFWDFFELRPSALMSIHVEKKLWEAFIETRK